MIGGGGVSSNSPTNLCFVWEGHLNLSSSARFSGPARQFGLFNQNHL